MVWELGLLLGAVADPQLMTAKCQVSRSLT